MASELSNLIDQELKKMEEQPESQRLLRVKVGHGFAAPESLPCTPAVCELFAEAGRDGRKLGSLHRVGVVAGHPPWS